MSNYSKIKLFFSSFLLLLFISLKLSAQDSTIEFTQEETDWISSHQLINVGNERYWPPIDFVIDGEPLGYSIDLMNLIANNLGIEINYVNGLSWSELLEALNNGTIDVLPAISKTDDREAYIKFSKAYINLPYTMVVNSALLESEYINLEKKTIAVFKGSNIENAARIKYPNVNLLYINTVAEGIKKVSTGEVDVFIENLGVVDYYLNESYFPNIKLKSDQLDFLISTDVCIGVLKKNEILGNLIDKGLDAVSKENIILLRKKWMPVETQKSEASKPEILLTNEEKQWISSQESIKVASSTDWAPFNFSENGTPKGYSIELLQLVGKKTGLPLEYISVNTWSEILENFKNGELDILPSVYFTESRKEFISFTESYAANPSIIVVNAQNTDIKTLEDLLFKKVAVISGFASAEVLDSRYPDIEQIYVNNVVEGLNAISLGNVDAFIASIGTVSYLIDKNLIPNVKIIGNINIKHIEETELFFGVAKDNIILRDILQKGLDAVTIDEKNIIRQKWMPVEINQTENFQNEDLLTVEEREWVSSLQAPINVANELDWPPFDYFENGKPAGYSIDLIQLIAQKTGLKINLVNGYTWNELIDLFIKDEIQIMPAVYKTEERLSFMEFTTDYYTQPTVLITNINDDINSILDLRNKNIAVIEGFAITEILERNYPDINRIVVNNTLDGLMKVSTGELDGFVESIGVVSSYMKSNFIPNLKISSDVSLDKMNSPPLYISVTKDNIILRDIIQKGLDNISKEELKLIHDRWITIDISSGQNDDNLRSADLWKIIIISLIGFIILITVIRYFLRTFVKEKVSLEFGSQRFRSMTMLGMLFIVLIMSLLGWWATERIKTKTFNDLENNLETTLANSHDRLLNWIDQRKSFVQQLGRDPILAQATQEILNISMDKNALLSSEAVNKVREFYEDNQVQLQSIGFYIINKENLNLTSSRNESLTNLNFIYNQKPGLINQVFKGNTVFVPPIESDVVLNDSQNVVKTSKLPTMFFVAPIESANGEVLAALAIQVDPAAGFSKVMQYARVGETGESYAFDHNGRLLSESRFDDDLRQIGLISQNQQGILQMEIRDPGGNMVKGFRSDIPRHQQPLTRMAASAIKGITKTDMTGYRDYRGVLVYGTWLWDSNLGIGMTAEIDVKEGKSIYKTMLFTIIGVIGVAILLMIFAILFTLRLGENANVALIKAKDELETRVIERTQELDNEKSLLNSLIDAIPDLIFYKDTNFKFLGANKAFEKQIGYKKKDIIGKTDSNFIPEDLAAKFQKSDKVIISDTKSVSMESEETDPEGKKIVFDTKKTPFFNEAGELLGLIGISRDITQRKKAELRLKSQSAALKSAANGIVITNINGEVVWVNPAFTKLTGYAWREVVGKNPRLLGSGKHDKSFYDDMWKTILAGETWQGEIINKKKNGELFHEEMTITPVLDDKGEISQFVAIKNDITERKQLEEVMVKAKERMENELNVAKDIQMSMLPLIFPAFPKRDEIDIYAELIPAREVGGDFYDFYFLDENHICYVMGDVSGKGVPAALMMAVTKTLLKSRAGNDKSTASILTHVNNEIAKDNDTYMFITVFIAILNTNTGKLLYSNAGHNPSYIINKTNKKITKLGDLHGPVIGAMEEMTYGETSLVLKKNEIVLCYTDGVTESQNINEELYSDARFEELLKKGKYDSSSSLVKLIVASVKEFEGEADQFDDITVMALEYRQNPE